MRIYRNYKEKFYSTASNYDLDFLLENAFLDGFEYFQREFSRKDSKYQGLYEVKDDDEILEYKKAEIEKNRKRAKKLGIASGITGATSLAGGGYALATLIKNNKEENKIQQELWDARDRILKSTSKKLSDGGINNKENIKKVESWAKKEVEKAEEKAAEKLKPIVKKSNRAAVVGSIAAPLSVVSSVLGSIALSSNRKKKALKRELSDKNN